MSGVNMAVNMTAISGQNKHGGGIYDADIAGVMDSRILYQIVT